MKKIFTLLFCVVALALSASANDRVDQCIDVLLGKVAPTKAMATDLDANHDGVITIQDVSVIIDEALEEMRINKVPAQKPASVDAIINDILDNEPPTPNISEVSEAIDRSLEKKQQK